MGAAHAVSITAGGELESVEQCTSDAYLRRWLFAREWDVSLTHQCIIKHAGWRAHVMPHGFIDEVGTTHRQQQRQQHPAAVSVWRLQQLRGQAGWLLRTIRARLAS